MLNCACYIRQAKPASATGPAHRCPPFWNKWVQRGSQGEAIRASLAQYLRSGKRIGRAGVRSSGIATSLRWVSFVLNMHAGAADNDKTPENPEINAHANDNAFFFGRFALGR